MKPVVVVRRWARADAIAGVWQLRRLQENSIRLRPPAWLGLGVAAESGGKMEISSTANQDSGDGGQVPVMG